MMMHSPQKRVCPHTINYISVCVVHNSSLKLHNVRLYSSTAFHIEVGVAWVFLYTPQALKFPPQTLLVLLNPAFSLIIRPPPPPRPSYFSQKQLNKYYGSLWPNLKMVRVASVSIRYSRHHQDEDSHNIVQLTGKHLQLTQLSWQHEDDYTSVDHVFLKLGHPLIRTVNVYAFHILSLSTIVKL